jgi:hypothetical protein
MKESSIAELLGRRGVSEGRSGDADVLAAPENMRVRSASLDDVAPSLAARRDATLKLCRSPRFPNDEMKRVGRSAPSAP